MRFIRSFIFGMRKCTNEYLEYFKNKKRINIAEDFNFKQAFSLIELAIVLLVVGLVLVAALGGRDLIVKSRIAKAGQLTENSPLKNLSEVTLWFEATQDLSFKESEHEDYTDLSTGDRSLGIGSITKWYDRNPHPVKRKNSLASSISQAPKYYQECINKISCLKFDGSQNYLTVNNTEGLTLKDYSIFIVEKKNSIDTIPIISSDSNATQNESLEIGYSNSNTIYWGQGNLSFQREYQDASLAQNKPRLHSFINTSNKSNSSDLKYYLNIQLITTSNPGTIVDFTSTIFGSGLEIGKSGSSFYSGNIGEIIILPFPVSKNQRIHIQKYLMTKWGIN